MGYNMIPIVAAFAIGTIAGGLALEGYYKYARKPKPHIRTEIAQRVRAALDAEFVSSGGLTRSSLQDLRDGRDVHMLSIERITTEMAKRRASNRAKYPTVSPSIRTSNG